MKHLLIMLFILLSTSFVTAEIRINEIMYNPEGNDNNKEFIEIYSDENINLSDYIISDSDSNDTLTLLQYYDSNFYLITEEGFNFSTIEASIYSAGNTIGNDLNLEDNITIYYNGSIIDTYSYTDVCESGYSLEYLDGYFYCSFYLNGTPGKQNSNRNQDYTNIEINEFYPDPLGDDNEPMPEGEFIELYNEGNKDIDLVRLYFKDSANNKVYISDTTTIDGTTIPAKDYLVVYMNGFSGLLNNEGFEEITLYDPDGNIIDKSNYADSKEELSWSLVDNIWQYRLPTPNEKNTEEEPEEDSYFKIEGLEDVTGSNKAKFGDIIKVKFHVYKGDTSKKSIKLYIKNDEDKISKITKAELPNRFTNYSMTLPIQIYPNCDKKYEDDDYYVNIGWTSSSQVKDSYTIILDGIDEDNCEKIYVEPKPRKGTLDYSLSECPSSAQVAKEFKVKVELFNNDGSDHMVDLSSYVYRGSKCYSIDREANKKTVLVKAGENKEFELSNLVPEAKPGDYKLKIKIKREDQKTEKSITHEIKLLSPPAETDSESLTVGITNIEEKTNLPSNLSEDSLILIPESRFEIVYESSNFKSQKLVPTLIMLFLLGFNIFLIFTKNFN